MDSSELTKFRRNRTEANSNNGLKATKPANKITQMSAQSALNIFLGGRKVMFDKKPVLPNCGGTNGAGCNQDLIVNPGTGDVTVEPPNAPVWHVDTIPGILDFLPQQAAVDSQGNIYVTGYDPNPPLPLVAASRIYRIAAGGGAPVRWFEYDTNPLPDGSGDFKSSGLVIDSSDNLYTVYYDSAYDDLNSYQIFIVRISTATALRDTGSQTTISANYQGPFYMAINQSNGDIYFTGKNAVYKTTTTLTTPPPSFPPAPVNSNPPMIAGVSGAAGFVDGLGNSPGPVPPGPARFRFPRGIVFSQGYLFVADSGNSAIRRIETASPYNVLTIAGQSPTPTPITSNVYNTTYPLARFNNTWGIGIEQQSLPFPIFYIGDTLNNQIKKMQGNVTLFAGVPATPTTNPAPAGDLDGLAPNATFWEPISLLVVPVASAPGFPKIYVSCRDTTQSGVGSDNNFRLISYY
jgi:hypothetical protein